MLTLKNVCWKPEDGEAVLRGIDLQVQTGKLTVVTGPNGGGKTSLAKVIAGLNQITEGSILLDGIDITDMDITCLLYTSLRHFTAGAKGNIILKQITSERNRLWMR